MGNRRNLDRRKRADGMVELAQQQATEIEDVAWEMEAHDLPLSVLHGPIAAHHAVQQQ